MKTVPRLAGVRPWAVPALLPLSVALAALPSLAQAQSVEPPAGAASAPAKPRAPAAQPAAKSNEQLQRVEVSGGPSDEAVRRASTASKIIITREEIDRFGDSSVGETLKRLPGVTTGGRPGRGGEVRMRGMGGGYTQILVNGERMPPGFSLDQLPPEQVERIEVMRAPTAEFGARAVAGTINVVLREALQKRLNDWRAGLSLERGHFSPSLSWSRNDKLDDQGGAYNLSINMQQSENRDNNLSSSLSRDRKTGLQSLQRTETQSEDQRRNLHLTSRLQWRLDGGDTLAIQPFVMAMRSKSQNQAQLQREGQVDSGLNTFDRSQTSARNNFEMLRFNTQWNHRIDEETRLELRAGAGAGRGDSSSVREEFKTGLPGASRIQQDTTDSRDRNWSLNGKVSRQLENEHSLVAGLEGEGTRREQERSCLQDGLACPGLLEFGDDLSASTQRVALYAQDEWSVGKQWSFYAGLRGETIATRSSAASYAVSHRASVWTPLLHGVWKFNEKSRDQIRASLTRSYRSPNLQDLIARPSINSFYPCPSGKSCGANEVDHPDRAGNPLLRPELATGIDIAYENYLSKGGILSASFFARRITDLMRNVTTLETVSWASVPRWVTKPTNIGRALTMGVELEAKFRLDEFIEDAWPVNLRSNLSLFSSRVDGIPGPNNRLDPQPRATANLGADYKLRSLPLSLGAGLNWTPANTVQQNLLTEARSSRKVVLDAFALWSIDRDTQLRLAASNLAPLDYTTGTTTTTDTRQVVSEGGGRSYTVWQLRLEMKI